MRVLVDTQVLVWEVIDPERLWRVASAAIDRQIEDQEPLSVSAFSLVEVAYAVEKASNPLSATDSESILRFLAERECPFEVLPVDFAVAARVAQVPRALNADTGGDVRGGYASSSPRERGPLWRRRTLAPDHACQLAVWFGRCRRERSSAGR